MFGSCTYRYVQSSSRFSKGVTYKKVVSSFRDNVQGNEVYRGLSLIVFRFQALRLRFLSLFSFNLIVDLIVSPYFIFSFFICPVSVFDQLVWYTVLLYADDFISLSDKLLVRRISSTNTIPIMYVTIASTSMPDENYSTMFRRVVVEECLLTGMNINGPNWSTIT